MSFGFEGISLENIGQIEFVGNLTFAPSGTAFTWGSLSNPSYLSLDSALATFAGRVLINDQSLDATALEIAQGDLLWTTDGDGQIGFEYINRPHTISAKSRILIGHTTGNQFVSAALSINSTTTGFLPPRMTTIQRDAIASPDTGLLVYNTDSNEIEVWNGTIWITGGSSTVETDPLSIHKDGSTSPSANINWAGFRLINLGNPTSPQDAATKSYVDSGITGFLKLDGSNSPSADVSWASHKITNLANPTSPQDAVTKNYVDTVIAAPSIHIDGSLSPTADISWASHRITNLATPLSANDAVNKAYADSQFAQSIHTNGSSTVTSDISWGAFKLTNLGSPLTSADAANKGYVDSAVSSIVPSIHLDGSNSPSANISWASHRITNLADPMSSQDAATKFYVDNLLQGLSWKATVRSGTTAPLPSYTYNNGASGVGATITATTNGALPAQDGVTLVVNDRLLVKDETGGNQPFNGIYIVSQVGDAGTPFILTRSSDLDQSSEFNSATVEVGPEAATQSKFIYWQSTVGVVVGTSNVVFDNISQGIAFTFGNGLIVSGNMVSVNPDNSTIDINMSSQVEVKAGGITNTQVSASAAIDYSKLASLAGTTNSVLVRDGSGFVAASSILSTNLFLADGSVLATAPFNLNSNKIINLANPTNPQDAATKNYVDSNGANTALSNLTNPTAINQNLLFGSDNTNSIGASGANRPSNIFAAGTISPGAGSASLPSLYLASDTTTGWYRSAANEWSFSLSATPQLIMRSGGLGNLQTYWETDLSGFGIGFGPSSAGFANIPVDSTIVSTTNSFPNALSMYAFQNNVAGPIINLRKARGTLASPAAALSGDALGIIRGHSYDGVSFTSENSGQGWSIGGFATQNWSSTAHGSQVILTVTPNNTTTISNALILDQDSSATFASSIKLAAGSGANLLWNTDAAGDIGSPDVGVTFKRPHRIYAQTLIQVGNLGEGIQLGGATGGSTGTITNNGIGFTIDSSAQFIQSNRSLDMQNFNIAFSDGSNLNGGVGFATGGVGSYHRPGNVAAYNSFQLGGTYTTTPGFLLVWPTQQRIVLQPNGTPLVTTTATTSTIYTYGMANSDNTLIAVTADVVARRTDSADRAYFRTTVFAYREASGGVTIQGTPTIDYSNVTGTSSAWNVSWTVDNSGINRNLLLQVTGAAGQTIDWNGSLEIHLVQ